MMTKIWTIEGSQKDVSSLVGTKFIKKITKTILNIIDGKNLDVYEAMKPKSLKVYVTTCFITQIRVLDKCKRQDL